MEHALHPWVTYGILPLFAFANAGVRVVGHLADALTHPVSIGIVVGLVIGKQVGITSFAALAVRLRLANLPAGVTWQHIYGAAWLGGIGFTMALFIGALAFTDPRLVEVSKVGILVASLIAGIGGYTVLRLTTWPAPTAETGDS
jgi:NhaA family Na+:H+ antiporter